MMANPYGTIQDGTEAVYSANEVYNQEQTENLIAVAKAEAENFASTADSAVTTEAHSYADTQDGITLQASKDYADAKDVIELAAAKSYADAQDASLDAATLASAQAYARSLLGLTVGSSLKEELTYISISSSFPYWCLNQPNTTITAALTPDLASAMRNYKLRMKPWSDDISTWDCSAWSTSGSAGVLTFAKNANLSGTVTAADSATLTFSASQSLSVGDILILSTGAIVRVISGATTSWVVDIKVTISAGTARIATYEALMIGALYYAQEKHGNYTDWFCLTLTSAIGNIPAGDYAISGLSLVSNTITIVTSATAGSGSGTFSGLVEIYPFRIPASSDARHYSWAGHTLVNAGGDEHTLVAGLMRLDYSQGHRHTFTYVYPANGDGGSYLRTGSIASYLTLTVNDASNDTVNGTPRTNKRTHGADAAIYTYIYAGQVN